MCEFFDSDTCNLIGNEIICKGDKSNCPQKDLIKEMGYEKYFTGEVIVKSISEELDNELNEIKEEWL